MTKVVMRISPIQGLSLVILGLLMTGGIIYLYNPQEKARQKRDKQRIEALETIKKSIDKYLANNGNESAAMCDSCKLDSDVFTAQSITLKGTNSTIVIDSSAVNITGWAPIDFSLNAKINETPISELPLDPIIMIVLGIMVAGLVISIILPIYNITSAF